MSSTCDVCRAQPSKYKCPNCTVKYCSLACFKSHKPTHNSNDNPSSSTATATAVATEEPRTSTTTSAAPAPPTTAATAPATAPADEDTTLTALLASPALHHLLRKHPSLRPTLRSIYASTIEPDPDDWADRQRRAQQQQRSFNTNNFRGGRGGRGGGRGMGSRGRGRGRGRGGAPPEGEWVGLDGQKARGPWRQEAADKFAVERLVRAQQLQQQQAGGGGDEGAEAMREFVALVTAAVAEAEAGDGGRMDEEGGD